KSHTHSATSHPTPPTNIHPLSLHDALPICKPLATKVPTDSTGAALGNTVTATVPAALVAKPGVATIITLNPASGAGNNGLSNPIDRKSTRLNSSHVAISYAVFCLKKKKTQQ